MYVNRLYVGATQQFLPFAFLLITEHSNHRNSSFKDFRELVACVSVCLTLCDPTDCSPPGSSIHRIFLAKMVEWVTISSARGSSSPRNRTHVSFITGTFFTSEPPQKPSVRDPEKGMPSFIQQRSEVPQARLY